MNIWKTHLLYCKNYISEIRSKYAALNLRWMNRLNTSGFSNYNYSKGILYFLVFIDI